MTSFSESSEMERSASSIAESNIVVDRLPIELKIMNIMIFCLTKEDVLVSRVQLLLSGSSELMIMYGKFFLLLLLIDKDYN